MNSININPGVMMDQARLNQLRSTYQRVEGDNSGLLNSVQNNFNTNASEQEKLRKVCEEFESLFVLEMYKAMRKTLNPENRLINGGMAEDIFTGMLDEQYAKLTSQNSSWGLADTIYSQLSEKLDNTNVKNDLDFTA